MMVTFRDSTKRMHCLSNFSMLSIRLSKEQKYINQEKKKYVSILGIHPDKTVI